MITRNEYKDRSENYSKSYPCYNEPYFLKDLDVEVMSNIRYINMKEVYDTFSSTIANNGKNFIVTTGCEAALRITLQVLKRINEYYDIYSEYPTWGMVPVIFDQIFYDDKELKKIEFRYNTDNKSFYYEGLEYLDIKSKDIIYTTYRYNNLFEHQNHIFDAYNIIDFTYTDPKVAYKEYMNICLDNPSIKNKIIGIGSFSKVYGCGYRLGYIFYPENDNTFRELFNLYREEYISSHAAFLLRNITSFSSEYNKRMNIAYDKNIYVTYTSNYATVPKRVLEYPDNILPKSEKEYISSSINKEFIVKNDYGDDTVFLRIGIH